MRKYKIINRNTGNTIESHPNFKSTVERIEELNALFGKDKFYFKCTLK